MLIPLIFILVFAGVLATLLFRRKATEPSIGVAHTPDDEYSIQDTLAIVALDTVVVRPIVAQPTVVNQDRPAISFEIAYEPVKAIEGGYQRLRADRGNYNSRGELVGTNWGIAAPVAERFYGRTVTTADMRALTEREAAKIFRRLFWLPLRAVDFPTQELANIVFDGFVNHGIWGVRLLQRVLRVAEDGVVGPRTLAAIRARDPDDVYRAYYQARLQFYRAIVRNRPDQKVFERGWLRRLNRYRPAELPA